MTDPATRPPQGAMPPQSPGGSPSMSSGRISLPSKRIIAAATRFKEAWDSSLTDGGLRRRLSDFDVVEMHEAAVALMVATKTETLQEALDVLHSYDAE
jgi:hypothetical protein